MMELADRRRIADFDEAQTSREDRRVHFEVTVPLSGYNVGID
jgi:hypothetical protein